MYTNCNILSTSSGKAEAITYSFNSRILASHFKPLLSIFLFTKRVASELTIPVIGIGAGGAVDGQVLVVADMLGMTNGFSPRFLRRYADLHTVMTDAIGQYVTDVKSGDFPNESEQY